MVSGTEDPEPNAGLPAMLRSYRRRAMLTQEDVASRTGLSARTIRRLEGGKLLRPRTATIRLLAEQLVLSSTETAALVDAGGAPSHRSTTSDPPPTDVLPSDLSDFTGRAEVLAELSAALVRDGASTPAPLTVESCRLVGVSGPPGVGKTALAIHVGHLLRDHFPDGRIYLDLHGLDERPLSSSDALSRLLSWCLAAGSDLPDGPDQRADVLRATLADRRVLLILDNAASEAQVRPLLPAARGCAVLVTSRRSLAALDNLRQLDLALFAPEEAVELLHRVVGRDRGVAEPAAAAQIVDLCGRLPLAVRVAAARLSARPHWTLERMSRQLADEHHRLDALTVGDRAVRASIELSYRALEDRPRQLFHRLGLLTDTVVPAWVAAPLLDCPPSDADDVLEELVDARLVEVHTGAEGGARYGLHSLVRLFALEHARNDGEQDRRAAAERFIGAWLNLAEHVAGRLPGGFPRVATGNGLRYPLPGSLVGVATADPSAWFARERLTLTAAVVTACRYGAHELVWDLVGCLGRFLELTGDYDLWEFVLREALATTRAAGNRRGEAHLLRALAEVLLDRDQYAEARESLLAAGQIFTAQDESAALAHVERALGCLERITGDSCAAAARLERALDFFSAGDELVGRADALYSMGALRRDQGRNAEALTYYSKALELERILGNRLNQALLVSSIGSALLAQDRVSEARSFLQDGLAVAREVQHGEGFALAFLGEADTRSGDTGAAARHLTAALVIFRRGHNRYGEALVLRNLGDLQRVHGQLSTAYSTIAEALSLWEDLGAPLQRARTLVSLGRLQQCAGNPAGARATWEEAERVFSQVGSAESDQVRSLLAAGRD